MEDLSKDIVSEILSHVTGEFILSCKLVSKTWETLLRHRKVKMGILYFATACKDDTRARVATFHYGDYEDILSDYHTVNPFKTLTKTIKHPTVHEGSGVILIGSCNGLVCLGISPYGIPDPVHICNPFTGEYANLPRLNMDKCYETYQTTGLPQH
ncbi:hypothetical protein MKX01_036361, partial [Papaver californicum]